MRCVVALASPVASTTSVNRECVSAASSTSRVFSLAPTLVAAPAPEAVATSSPAEWSGAVWMAMVLNLLCRGRVSGGSAHLGDGEAIHVVERLVLAGHRPHEAVARGADTRVHRPARGDDSLLVADHEVPRLGRLTHEVDD